MTGPSLASAAWPRADVLAQVASSTDGAFVVADTAMFLIGARTNVHTSAILLAVDQLVQRGGTAVLRQRERLLDIALAHLPKECDAVAWLDGDVVTRSRAGPPRAHEGPLRAPPRGLVSILRPWNTPSRTPTPTTSRSATAAAA